MSVQTLSTSVATLSDEKKQLLKNTICKGATDDEMALFIHICERTKLDPFARQIYAIKRSNQMTIQTGIDGLRLVAERTGKYMPGRESTFVYDERGNLISATSYVKKMDSANQWHEIAATAHFNEYNAGSPIWKKMPCTMLSKCAESCALRRAFPADLSGIYSKEEMEQADTEIPSNNTIPLKETAPPLVEAKEIQLITPDQAEYIEVLIGDNDEEYKEQLLKFFSSINKMEIKDFTSLPAANFESCVRSIKRRIEAKEKVNEEVPF